MGMMYNVYGMMQKKNSGKATGIILHTSYTIRNGGEE